MAVSAVLFDSVLFKRFANMHSMYVEIVCETYETWCPTNGPLKYNNTKLHHLIMNTLDTMVMDINGAVSFLPATNARWHG